MAQVVATQRLTTSRVNASLPLSGKRRAPRRHLYTTPHASSREPLELPGGGFWWMGMRNEPESLIYADQFVIHRPRTGGPGLVPSPSSLPQRYQPQQATSTGMVHKKRQSLNLALAGYVVIDTEAYEVIDIEEEQGPIQPNNTCFGIVPHASSRLDIDDEKEEEEIVGSKHPRRTQKIQFTCNLCNTTSIKEVNPRAWRRGSVFARCDECTAVHKLVDNLKIFDEVGGEVFPPRDLRSNFLAQEILDKIAKVNNIKRTKIIRTSGFDGGLSQGFLDN